LALQNERAKGLSQIPRIYRGPVAVPKPRSVIRQAYV
jgi:hypothetical protein